MKDQINQPIYTIIKTLKIDMFGIISLATYQNQTVIVRDLNIKNKFLKIIAKYLNRNEVQILKKINKLNIPNFSKLIKTTPTYTIRSYIPGTPLNQHPEKLNEAFFTKALNLVQTMHENGIVHNDLEKQENWIIMKNGEPAFIDFQLARYFKKEKFLFKVLKKIELRNVIKSKRWFCSKPLRSDEIKILNNKGRIHKFFKRFMKPIYNFVTRRLLNYSDRKYDLYSD